MEGIVLYEAEIASHLEGLGDPLGPHVLFIFWSLCAAVCAARGADCESCTATPLGSSPTAPPLRLDWTWTDAEFA